MDFFAEGVNLVFLVFFESGNYALQNALTISIAVLNFTSLKGRFFSGAIFNASSNPSYCKLAKENREITKFSKS
jgi:hypothetical protein